MTDLSGFDPADKNLDPKTFLVERSLEQLQIIENLNTKLWNCLIARDIGGAMEASIKIKSDLDYMGLNGHMGRLKQHFQKKA